MDSVRRLRTGWLLATVLALGLGTVAQGASGPRAEAADSCDGVWVVVDATRIGGAVTTRCAEGDPPDGLAALDRAGHSYSFVPRIPGMICTIDRRPDPCNGAPSDAYWSYWHASAGGEWTYSTRGAGNHDPEPGTVEGWSFGAGEPPGRRPPPDAPATTDPASTDEPPPPSDGATPTPSPAGSTEDSGGARGGPNAASSSVDDPAEDAASPTSQTPAPSPVPVTDEHSAAQPDDGPEGYEASPPGPAADVGGPSGPTEEGDDRSELAAATGQDAGGSPFAFVVGLALVAVIAGAGALRARRRAGT